MNYKFTGKERDSESGNDDFDARYYSNRFGRWLSADWSAVPVPVPYANLTNPETLNLYAMVADDPESFADLDGHGCSLSLNGGGVISCSGNTWLPYATQGEGPVNKGGTGVQNTQTQNQTQAQAAANANQPINVSVGVVKEPQMLENVETEAGTSTGVGAVLSYTYTDSNGKPISGASITEKNTVNDNGKVVERSGAVTTDAKGTINDVVMKGGPSATMPGTVADLKAYVTSNPITLTSTQTQTVKVGGKSYEVTSTRTLTNVGPDGKLNTKFNSHGVNFRIDVTKPVIKVAQ